MLTNASRAMAPDFPFRGDVSVSPEAYATALENFDAIGSRKVIPSNAIMRD